MFVFISSSAKGVVIAISCSCFGDESMVDYDRASHIGRKQRIGVLDPLAEDSDPLAWPV